MISFIFPAFNEAENLRRFPAEVVPVFDCLGEPYEIVVVDDGSTDDTRTTASTAGAAVRVVAHERNRGLGAAIRTGILAARGDLVVTMDTDLTFAPSLVSLLLERYRRGDVDLVSGSPALAGYAADVPAYRVFVGRMSATVYSVLFGSRLTAVTPIFRLYRREDLLALPLQATGFDINAEILFHLVRQGKRVAEVPAALTHRLHGTSKLHYGNEVRRHLRLTRRILAWRVTGLAQRAALHL